jgi:SSS family solute:Na+ symporter
MAARNMSAARRTPLIAAIPKMVFPALVILPGMLAVALASMGKDNYRLPPKPLDKAVYEKILPAIKQASAAGLQGEAALKAVNDVIGEKKANDFKFSQVKIAAIVSNNASQPLPEPQLKERLQDAVTQNDYDGVILSLVKRYCPTGLLGLALTALLASFMSGMAGNVTAFNTVWTYDLYQAYLARNKSDAHYLWMGRVVTVVGILLSIACAYFASFYNNAMDVIQLVFGFVNAPLFATFLLGMFWARTTGTGAFLGLLGGTATSGIFHALCQGRVPRRGPRLPQRDGPKLLAGQLRLHHLFRPDRRHLPGHGEDQDRRGTQGPGLLVDTQDQGRRAELAAAPRGAGRDPAGRLCCVEHPLLVTKGAEPWVWIFAGRLA